MINEIKYIITDLDGTILRSTSEGISKKTIKIINDFQEKSNYKLTFATGRHLNMINEYFEQLNIKLPVITSNGALIKDIYNNKIINTISIEKNDFKTILKELKNNNIDVVIYSDKNIYLEYNSDRLTSIKKYNNKTQSKFIIDHIAVNNILEVLNTKENILKLLLTLKNKEKELIIINNIIQKFPNLMLSASHDNMYDINNINSTKGYALKQLCKKLNWKQNEVLVYGDNENDIEIFKEAGYSVVVSNGIKELKKIASEIIDDVRTDSVANHIDKNFLKKKISNN